MSAPNPWRSVADDPPPLDTPVVVLWGDGSWDSGYRTMVEDEYEYGNNVYEAWFSPNYTCELDPRYDARMDGDPDDEPVWWLDPAALPAPPTE